MLRASSFYPWMTPSSGLCHWLACTGPSKPSQVGDVRLDCRGSQGKNRNAVCPMAFYVRAADPLIRCLRTAVRKAAASCLPMSWSHWDLQSGSHSR